MHAGSGKALRAGLTAVIGLAALLICFVASSPPAPAASSSPAPSASSTPAIAPSGSATAAPNAPGGETYKTLCAGCHGPQGEGVAVDGPSLKAAAFPDIVGQKVQVGGGGMPAFSQLPNEQIQGVAAYVTQEIADPAAREAKVGEGGVLYRLYCSGCHSATGRGGALSSGPNAPSFAGMPAANALAGMEIGPRSMPVFASTLDNRQKAAITLYVQQIVSPDSPGGNGLGFIGPVIEGAVAWFGFVVLVLIAVWLAWGKRGERV